MSTLAVLVEWYQLLDRWKMEAWIIHAASGRWSVLRIWFRINLVSFFSHWRNHLYFSPVPCVSRTKWKFLDCEAPWTIFTMWHNVRLKELRNVNDVLLMGKCLSSKRLLEIGNSTVAWRFLVAIHIFILLFIYNYYYISSYWIVCTVKCLVKY